MVIDCYMLRKFTIKSNAENLMITDNFKKITECFFVLSRIK